MKLISFVLLSLVIFLVGCGTSSEPRVSAKATNPPVNMQPSPSPSPTMDRAAEDRKNALENAKSLLRAVESHRDDIPNSPEWKAQIKTATNPQAVCDAHVRYGAAEDAVQYMEAHKEISFAEASKTMDEAKLNQLKLAWAKDFITHAKAVSADAYLKRPCQNDMVLNFVEINEEMIEVMEKNNLHPKDFGLTPAAIRTRLLEGYKQMIAAWREGKWNQFEVTGETDITRELSYGMDNYGFKASDFGITLEEEVKIRANETDPNAKAE